MDHESIISSFINKIPNRSLVYILRGYRNLPYFEFRDKLRLHWQEDDHYRTTEPPQTKATTAQYQRMIGHTPYNKPTENAIKYPSEPDSQVTNITYAPVSNQSQSSKFDPNASQKKGNLYPQNPEYPAQQQYWRNKKGSRSKVKASRPASAQSQSTEPD